jgi:protein-S-isoprenylcysteine O-methyltransferase Ste14
VLLGLLALAGLPGLRGLAPGTPLGWLLLAIGILFVAVGGWLVAAGFRDLGPSLTPLPRPRDDAVLVERGIYETIRHPIYAGLIGAGLGWSLVTRSLAAAAVTAGLALYLDLKSRREEAWLEERYPGYAGYRSRTRRFVPRIY